MTRQEIAKSTWKMRAFRRKVTSSREEAVRALKSAGILDQDGKVAEPYRTLFSN
jgi:hypothetical protein